jgi:hypothetical protein
VIPGRERVATALYNDTNAKRILADVMRVQPPDDNVWEQVLSESIRNISWYYFEARDSGWKRFWATLRAAPVSVRNRFIEKHHSKIHIRQRGGDWVGADDILLPGALIQPDDTSTNQKRPCSGHARSWQPGRGRPHKSPSQNNGGLMCWQTLAQDDAGFRMAFIATAAAE